MSRVLGWLIRWSGLAWLVRHTRARNRVSVVLYHDPAPERFAAQLDFLTARYSLIPLTAFVDALESGDWGSLPSRPLVITIDDGHAGNYSLLYAAKTRGVRPAIFVCSQIAGTSRHFWFLDCDEDDLDSLKSLSDAERLARLERGTGFSQDRDYGTTRRQALSTEELAAIREHFEVQSHGRYHPVLTHCGPEQAAEEIERSRVEVAELSGGRSEHFSYPLGAYRERELALVKRAGYRSARTVDIGWNGRRTDPYRLKILSVADDASETMLAAELTGLKWLLRLLKREGRLDGTFRPSWDRRVGR